MMELIFITGIGLLFVLLVVIVVVYSYMRFFPRRQTSLSLGAYSHCDLDINLLKIEELENQLDIELKQRKLYDILYILFVVVSSVVGILLASGFIQQVINPTLLGWIGIITLTCTLLNLIIRPEEKRKMTARRIVKLKAVIRKCKDLINGYNSSNDTPGALKYDEVCSKIMKMVNNCLAELEKENFI